MSSNRQGLNTMLQQLGITQHRLLAGIVMIAIFEVTIIGLATFQAWLEFQLSWSPVVVYSIVWLIWTIWHSWLFPRNRLQYLATSKRPYLHAFVLDIYPWVSLGFSQMWRPLINGDTWGKVFYGSFPFHPGAVTIGLSICVVSLVIIIHAIRAIGFHNAAFMGEFVDSESFVLLRKGIYQFVRHPLFWSGILYSCGLAIATATPIAYEIAAVNVLYGFVYHWLEDRRLRQIFGANYEAYRHGKDHSELESRVA